MCHRVIAIRNLAFSTLILDATCSIVVGCEVIEIAGRCIGAAKYFCATCTPVGIGRVIWKHDDFIGSSFGFIGVVHKDDGMRDEVVDVCLLAHPTFICERGSICDFCAIAAACVPIRIRCCIREQRPADPQIVAIAARGIGDSMGS